MENPEMVKEVKKWGDSLIIRFNADDIKYFKIQVNSKIKFKILEVENGSTN